MTGGALVGGKINMICKEPATKNGHFFCAFSKKILGSGLLRHFHVKGDVISPTRLRVGGTIGMVFFVPSFVRSFAQ